MYLILKGLLSCMPPLGLGFIVCSFTNANDTTEEIILMCPYCVTKDEMGLVTL